MSISFQIICSPAPASPGKFEIFGSNRKGAPRTTALSQFFNFAFYSFFQHNFVKKSRNIKKLVDVLEIFFRAFILGQSQPPSSTTSEVIAVWSWVWCLNFNQSLRFCLLFLFPWNIFQQKSEYQNIGDVGIWKYWWC